MQKIGRFMQADFREAREGRAVDLRGAKHEQQMKLTLETEENYAQMQALFATELARKHERSTIALEDASGKAVFRITASDTTALRAAVNTITSILGMHEKTREAIHGSREQGSQNEKNTGVLHGRN